MNEKVKHHDFGEFMQFLKECSFEELKDIRNNETPSFMFRFGIPIIDGFEYVDEEIKRRKRLMRVSTGNRHIK